MDISPRWLSRQRFFEQPSAFGVTFGLSMEIWQNNLMAIRAGLGVSTV